jgi:hypothetical protein
VFATEARRDRILFERIGDRGFRRKEIAQRQP